MTDDDKSLGDDATLGGESPEREIDARSLGDQSTHDGHSDTDSVGDSSSLGDQLTFGGEGTGEVLDDGMEIVDLESRYTIERVLGKGGMGEVLLATDTRLERKVAIKRILGKAARSKTAVNRFLTEAKAVAALNHTNIVQIHDYGRDKQGPFLIMEYVAGQSLLERCHQGAIALEEAIELTVQLCDGLAAAHDNHIVHRDVKPANILLTKNNIPKLTDFGLAKAEAADTGMTQEGAVLGTHDFMPPEQRKDAALVDARSDLWSLAATLYQMVTGETPRVIDLDALPRELRSSLAQALKTNKDDRYQTADEMGTALRECLTASAHTPITELGSGECPSCPTRNEASRKFCNGCAGPLRVPCFDCENEIPVWDKVCGECGSNQHEKVKQLQEERAKQRDEAEHLFKNGNYEGATEIAEGLVKTANVLDPRVPDQPEWVEEFLAKTNDQKIRQLQEEQTKQRGKAEQLLKDNDYDGASEIAERLMSSTNTSLPDSTDWAGNFLAKIASQRDAEIANVRSLMDEAIAHRDAHDYRAGLTVLDKIPRSLRRQTIPAHDKTPAELKEVFKHRLTQIQTLNQEIDEREKNCELDGLGKLVSELQGLQPGRPDLARLTQKLNERDARYAEMVDKALADASTFRQHCEFSKAVEKILEIPEEFRSEEVNALLTNCETLADYRESALQAISQANRSRFADYGNEKREKIQLAILRCGLYLKSLESAGLTDAEIQVAHTLYQEQESEQAALRESGMVYKIGIGGVALAVVFGLVIVLVESYQRSQRSSAIAEAMSREDYAAVLEIDPNNAQAQLFQNYLKKQADIKQALAKGDYQAALELDAYNAEALAMERQAYYKHADQKAAMKKEADIKQALANGDYQTALRLEPNNAEAQAMQNYAKKQAKINKALANGDYRTVLGLDPNNAHAVVMKRAATIKRAMAMRDYQTVLELDPGNADALELKQAEATMQNPRWMVLNGNRFNSVAFSPDGQQIAASGGSGMDVKVELWSVQTGKKLKTFSGKGHRFDILSVAFSPDGKTIASGSADNKIKLWDAESGEELRTLSEHKDSVLSVAFSPDGKTIASGSEDETLKLWDTQSGVVLNTISWIPDVTSVAFSPAGGRIVLGYQGGLIKLWDAESGRELDTLMGHADDVLSVAFSPDGKTLASGSTDKTIKLWNAQTGKELKTLSGHTSTVTSVAFSPDGRQIASGSADNNIKLWDAQSGEELNTLSGHTGSVRSVAFSPDGKTVASGSHDKTIKLWNVGDYLKLIDYIKKKQTDPSD